MLGRVSNCSVALQKSQPAQREVQSKDCLVEGFHIDQKWPRPWYLYWAHTLARDCLVKAQPQLNCCGGSQRPFSQGYQLIVPLTARLLVLS